MVDDSHCRSEKFLKKIPFLVSAAALRILVLKCLQDHVELVQIFCQLSCFVIFPLLLITVETIEYFFGVS